jgi:hypothetical protein
LRVAGAVREKDYAVLQCTVARRPS